MDRILITGGAGFIGSNLALKLLEQGCSVTVLDNLSPQIHGENPLESTLYNSIKDKVDFIHGSVLVKDDWYKALKGVDAVVHLAAETGTGQSMYQIERYNSVNIGGTSIFLDILTNEKHSIKKIVVASSRSIYGEGKYKCQEHGEVYPLERKQEDMERGIYEVKCPHCSGHVTLMATDEESKIHPSSFYGITKQVQEQMFLLAGKALGIPSIALRYQNVFGAGQSLSNPYTGILSIFSTRIKNGNNINIFEDGKESRDFIYIDDVVNATLLAIKTESIDNEVFNIGSGVPVTVSEVAESLLNAYKVGVGEISVGVDGSFRLGDIRHNYAELSKARSLLGFSPEVSFTDGVKRFVSWVDDQAVEKDL